MLVSFFMHIFLKNRFNIESKKERGKDNENWAYCCFWQSWGHILRDAIMRNHDVTAIVMNKATLKIDIKTIETDLFHLTPKQIAPFDVIINAFAPFPWEESLHIKAGKHLISLLNNTNKKLFVVGSSDCLYVDRNKTVRLLEHQEYPQHLVESAKAQLQNLKDLQNSSIQWTFLSPSATFDSDGPRTGHYVSRKRASRC